MAEKKPRATAAEMEQRTNAVYLLLLNATKTSAIYAHAKKTWDINSRQTDTLIARAHKLFEQQAATIRERELGKALARHEEWIQESLKVKDIAEARQNQKEINNLLALNAPQTIQILTGAFTPAEVKLLVEFVEVCRLQGIEPGKLIAELSAYVAQQKALPDGE